MKNNLYFVKNSLKNEFYIMASNIQDAIKKYNETYSEPLIFIELITSQIII